MPKLNTVRDGRQAHAYLLFPATEKATKLEVGRFYYIAKKSSSSSALPSIPLFRPFFCDKAVESISDPEDEAYELKAKFLGFANNKSMSEEKSVNDVTCDKDADANYVADGSVNRSGSISGYDLLGTKDSAISIVRSRFKTIVDTSGEEVTVIESSTTQKDIVAFVWDAKDTKPGETFGIDFITCFLTTSSREASYQSGQTFNLDFQGVASSDEGILPSYQQGKFAKIIHDEAAV